MYFIFKIFLGAFLKYITQDTCKLDSSGGTLALPEVGVKLEIPEGALPADTASYDVSMVLHQDDHPPISDDHLMMTPVIQCQCSPGETAFKKPVTLRLPHSVVDYEDIKKEDITLWYKSSQGWYILLYLELVYSGFHILCLFSLFFSIF